jgi:hypothetical protein
MANSLAAQPAAATTRVTRSWTGWRTGDATRSGDHHLAATGWAAGGSPEATAQRPCNLDDVTGIPPDDDPSDIASPRNTVEGVDTTYWTSCAARLRSRPIDDESEMRDGISAWQDLHVRSGRQPADEKHLVAMPGRLVAPL